MTQDEKKFAMVVCGMNCERMVDLPPQGVIIAASPITFQPASNPSRVVLRVIPKQSGMELVVHNQIWMDRFMLPDGSLSPQEPGSFDRGDYFYPFAEGANPVEVFTRAYKRWHERVEIELEYTPSLIRRWRDPKPAPDGYEEVIER